MPDDFYKITSVYNVTSRYSPDYNWLNWPISFVFILVPIFLSIKSNRAGFSKVILIVLSGLILLDLFRVLFGQTVSFALYLSVSIAYFSAITVKKSLNTDKIYWMFLSFNVLTVYLGFILQRKVINDSGDLLYANRFNAINLDIGFTGILCMIFVVLSYIEKPKHYLIFIITGLIGILLSGSRIALLAVILYFLIVSWQKGIKSILITAVVLIIGWVVLSGLNVSLAIRLSELMNSIIDIRLSNLTSNHDSLIGRIWSIKTGLKVLYNHPLGLGLDISNVQFRMNAFGYPTFPHSSLLVLILMIGPLGLLLYMFIYVRALSKVKGKYRSLVHIIFLYNIFAGGAIINPKIFFVYITLYLIAKSSDNEKYLHSKL